METSMRYQDIDMRKHTISDLKLLQDIQAHFCTLVGIENSPESVLNLLAGEVEELRKAIDTNDAKEIRSELADVVIFAATLANCFSFSLEEDITNKLSRNFHKYNSEV